MYFLRCRVFLDFWLVLFWRIRLHGLIQLNFFFQMSLLLLLLVISFMLLNWLPWRFLLKYLLCWRWLNWCFSDDIRRSFRWFDWWQFLFLGRHLFFYSHLGIFRRRFLCLFLFLPANLLLFLMNSFRWAYYLRVCMGNTFGRRIALALHRIFKDLLFSFLLQVKIN
jgi:hypothetical protein